MNVAFEKMTSLALVFAFPPHAKWLQKKNALACAPTRFSLTRATRRLDDKERRDRDIPEDVALDKLDSPRLLLEAENTLSDEVIEEIMLHCDARSLINLASTCHHLRRLSTDSLFWRRINTKNLGVAELESASIPSEVPNRHLVAFWHASRFDRLWSGYRIAFGLENVAIVQRSSPTTTLFCTFGFPLSRDDTAKLVQFSPFQGLRNLKLAPGSFMLLKEHDNTTFWLQLTSSRQKFFAQVQHSINAALVTIIAVEHPTASHNKFMPSNKLCDYLRAVSW
jgi:hypothetical protein